MGNVNDNKIKSMVMVAVFATITFLGIQAFRIPMPAAVGTPFVHFGHIFVVMGVLLLGGKRGAVSGTLGLVIFDLLNGFVQDIPQVFVETIVKCLIAGALMAYFRKRARGDRKKEYIGAVVCACVYAAMNIVIEFVMGIVKMMILGSGFQAALLGSASSIPATVINAVFMAVAVSVIYVPVRSIFQKVVGAV